MTRPILALAALAAVAAIASCGGDGDEPSAESPPAADPPAEQQSPARAGDEPRLETVATGLEAPWEIAFLPDGSALVTERPGRVRLLDADGRLSEQPVATIDRVAALGEGGLLGLAVDPDFEQNAFVYLYRTTDTGNEVVRFTYSDGGLAEQVVIVDGIQAAGIHNGGRLAFGPDGALYVTTGEAGDPALSQDPASRNGKLLRVQGFRGASPQVEIVSSGHRNVQGLDWQPGSERLYATEFGESDNDEVNLIEQGGNYGWPDATGDDDGGGRFVPAAATYADVVAPSGATFVSEPGSAWSGDLLFATLVGEAIHRLPVARDGTVGEDEALFEGELGRVRTVVEGPDGALYALTNNTDGRGSPREGDDRIVRITPPAA